MGEKNIVGYDVATPNADGTDNVTRYLLDLLNSCPFLDLKVKFQDIDNNTGISLVPLNNAAILSQKVSITNHVRQRCQYSFQLFRTKKGTTENIQISTKELLEKVASWLQQQEVVVDNKAYKLDKYPPMATGMKMKELNQATSAALFVRNDNQNEAWVIAINAIYEKEFDK